MSGGLIWSTIWQNQKDAGETAHDKDENQLQLIHWQLFRNVDLVMEYAHYQLPKKQQDSLP